MTPFDPAAIAFHVRRLDRTALRTFVADLWAARGYETTVDGDVVRATDDLRTVRIAVGEGARESSDPVDVLVAPGRRAVDREGIRVLDGADLAEMLRYAVEPAMARTLCERHFGAPPEALRASPVTRLRRRATAVAERTPPAPVIVLGIVALALVGAAQLPAMSNAGTAGSPANMTAGSSEPTPTRLDQTTPMAVPEKLPDWKSPPPGGYEQFICGFSDEPNASETATEDCVEAANRTVGTDRDEPAAGRIITLSTDTPI